MSSSLLATSLLASRPHLWTYTLGAGFLGALAASGGASESLVTAPLILFGFWLTVPAGWAIYALNDFFDGEADVGNPRKRGIERAASSGAILAAGLPLAGAATFLPLVWFLPIATSLAVGVAILATFAYSAPPLRLKGVPLLDGAFYLAPVAFGAAGYAAVAGELPPFAALLLAWVFSFAMHLYSAAIDVEADRAVGIRTVSVWLGAPGRSVFAAAALCLCVAAAALFLGGASWSLAALGYATFFFGHLASAEHPNFSAARWYGFFAALHFLAGLSLTAAAF